MRLSTTIRPTAAATLTAACLALAGCVSLGDAQQRPSSNRPTSPPTTNADSTASDPYTLADYFPPLGTPNPEDPNFTKFDPCTEIPAEVFERAGIGDMGELHEIGDYQGCGANVGKIAEAYIGLTVFEQGKDDIDNKLETYEMDIEKTHPEVYFLKINNDHADTCHALLDTTRGALRITVDVSSVKEIRAESCKVAAQTLTYLATNSGEIEWSLVLN